MSVVGDLILIVSCTPLLLLISVAFHELGHYIFAKAFGFEVQEVYVSFSGGFITTYKNPRTIKWYESFFISLAGPMFSLILSIIFLWVWASVPYDIFVLSYGCWLNSFLAAYNLLNKYGLDGYHAMKAWRFRKDEKAWIEYCLKSYKES